MLHFAVTQTTKTAYKMSVGGKPMQEDIFSILMLILLLCGSNGTENVNQLLIMFLMMQSRNGNLFGENSSHSVCGREDGFTF